MELVRSIWNQKDIEEFQNYLKSFENKEKKPWCSNILQTQMPLLAMKTKDIKDIVSKLSKGNFLSFLDHMVWEYYENTAINGFLISQIKDFAVLKKYLDIYSPKADNWATCDLLTFRFKGCEENYYLLAKEYSKSDKPFVRRIGINALFNLVDNNAYIDRIFELLDTFHDEKHYYVNMVNAWLLCDCFIKQRERTIKYFEKNKLNGWTINKAVQKCRESRRVSDADKDMLLKFKTIKS